MIKYEIREICGDWGVFEVRWGANGWEDATEECLLILNSRSNAEYIKAILEVDGSRPNAATIYSPVVEEMSDEECMAVFRLCCAEENHCKTCPLNNLGDGCFLHIDRRVMDIVERDLKKKASSTSCDMEDKPSLEKQRRGEYVRRIVEAVRYKGTDDHEDVWSILWDFQEEIKADYRKQSGWISVEERLPDECGMPVLMVAVNQYSQTRVVKGFTDYQCPITFHTNEKEYDGAWKAWEVTHWMPLPEPPKMKGGAE